MKSSGMSNPAIAERLGVDATTVHRDVQSSACADAQADNPAPEKVVGKDGKMQPGRKLTPEFHPAAVL